ncbi:hypothetical protein [Jiella sonneratiae]|uniref:Uncharacterized protein n=1 Tax=Jiella sonneratiae TaxID=2816856 RepID=A0ABS3JA19_9HYPH|nr:hypothetical protein [Jiella sonneratiae]MBO0906519.1 hypothetical protein [Jiella sonneratiae]
MSENTARRFMHVAKAYSGKSAIVADLDVTALYELAAPKTPIEVRGEVEKMIAAGEAASTRRQAFPRPSYSRARMRPTTR